MGWVKCVPPSCSHMPPLCCCLFWGGCGYCSCAWQHFDGKGACQQFQGVYVTLLWYWPESPHPGAIAYWPPSVEWGIAMNLLCLVGVLWLSLHSNPLAGSTNGDLPGMPGPKLIGTCKVCRASINCCCSWRLYTGAGKTASLSLLKTEDRCGTVTDVLVASSLSAAASPLSGKLHQVHLEPQVGNLVRMCQWGLWDIDDESQLLL